VLSSTIKKMLQLHNILASPLTSVYWFTKLKLTFGKTVANKTEIWSRHYCICLIYTRELSKAQPPQDLLRAQIPFRH